MIVPTFLREQLMIVFDDLISVAASLASEDKPLTDIHKTTYSAAYNALSTEQKGEVIRTYHEAVKYFKEWDREENEISSTLHNIDLLV